MADLRLTAFCAQLYRVRRLPEKRADQIDQELLAFAVGHMPALGDNCDDRGTRRKGGDALRMQNRTVLVLLPVDDQNRATNAREI